MVANTKRLRAAEPGLAHTIDQFAKALEANHPIDQNGLYRPNGDSEFELAPSINVVATQPLYFGFNIAQATQDDVEHGHSSYHVAMDDDAHLRQTLDRIHAQIVHETSKTNESVIHAFEVSYDSKGQGFISLAPIFDAPVASAQIMSALAPSSRLANVLQWAHLAKRSSPTFEDIVDRQLGSLGNGGQRQR